MSRGIDFRNDYKTMDFEIREERLVGFRAAVHLMRIQATKLFCAPEHVVDVILKFAESFNMHLKSFYYQLKEGNPRLNHFKLHEVRRCWNLLQSLVIASSGNVERSVLPVNVRNGFRFSNLVPTLAWLQKVPAFSSSIFPIVRYFGWMALARNAKQFLDERLFLVSELPELTYLLSIFSDDLSVIDNIANQKNADKRIEQLTIHPDIKSEDGRKSLGYEDRLQSFHALYPVISKFFPNLKEDFIGFGETILEAVGLQLKFLSTYMVPDLMCWFSDLCSCPFVQSKNTQALSQDKPDYYIGFVAKNAKAVILYILEAIVVEHMEAMVPEIPRVVQVFVSLCRTSYCDISFLESIMHLLKPIIAYSLSKVPAEEDSLIDDSCDNFESLCFSELFKNIKSAEENLVTPVEKGKCQALTIYVLASIFGNLSFQRKTELIQSALLWADFASSDGTNSFPDYICAYQVLMENCRDLLIATSKVWGIIPLKISADSDTSISSVDGFSKFSSWFLNDLCNPSSPSEVSGKHQDDDKSIADVSQKFCPLTLEEVKTLLKELEAIISKLNPTLEQCWRLHHKLSKILTLTCAECLLYLRCLQWITDRVSASSGKDLHPSKFVDDVQDIWRTSLEGLSKMILLLQDKHCWEVASVLLHSLLGVPLHFCLDNVISDICFAVKNFSNSAPNISWRILTDKLIQLLLARGVNRICQNEVPLVDLFCTMLVHPEPEQRYIALKHLGRLVGQDIDGGRLSLSSTTESIIASSDSPISANEQILSALVTATWDNVALIASSDTSLLLRTNATALLIDFIPFADRSKLQSFLASADSILQCLTSLAQPTCYGPLTQFSLALIASVFLYCPSEDISLIPESIWRSIETLGMSTIDRYCTSLEKKACEALCRLKNDGEQAKQVLKEVLSSSPPKQQLPDFLTTRESILMVIGNLTSAKSYLDFFSKEAEQKLMELEEAEIEMEFLQKEHPLPDSSLKFEDWHQLPFMSMYSKDDPRLQKIKEGIRSLEKAKHREEIVARRQQKLLLRRARQQFLEEATLREAELIQKLDREIADEVEKELERQQLLELERSKTRELRHNLEMEKEKQAQRDLQRELEQVESGVRPTRREFSSSSHTSRTRDRYRERETSREGSETGLRTSSRGGDATMTTGLAGRGSFSGQPPTILQLRERADECGSSYEENIDGSKDSGDTGSVGDPDMVSYLEGQSISFGSGQRHGSRGSKSRQIIERRERDGRREGKWERKH